jgi:O-antigen/teichoic acid export membrane protein
VNIDGSRGGADVLGAGPVARAMAQNLAALFTSRACVWVLQLVAVAVMAAHLGPREFGIYEFGIAFAGLFLLVPNFGFGEVAARDIAQNPRLEREVIPNLLYVRLLLGLGAYGALAVTASLVGYGPESRRAVLVAGVLLLLAIDSFRTVLEVRMRQAWTAIADVLEAVAILAGVLVLVRLDGDAISFVWAYVVANAVGAAFVAVVALVLADFTWRVRPGLFVSLTRGAAPLAAAALFIKLYSRIDIAILARLKPAGDVGQYGVAYEFLVNFFAVPGILMSVLLPVLARSFAEGLPVLARRYQRALHLFSLIAFPVAIGGAMTAWRALPALPGFASYEGAGVALSILAPAAGLSLLGSAVQGALISGHLQRRLLVISAGGFVLNLALNVALIPPFSYVGAAVATGVTEMLTLGWSMVEAHRRLGLTWPRRRLGGLVLANLALVAALVPGFALHPFLQVVLGAAAYCAVLGPVGVLSRADVADVLPRRRNVP